MIVEDERSNYETFRDCLSGPIIQKSAVKGSKPQKRRNARGRKNTIKVVEHVETQNERDEQGAEDLADFIDYLATESFTSLPADLRTLSFSVIQNEPSILAQYSDPLPSSTADSLLSIIPTSVSDSLTTYGLISCPSDLSNLLIPVFTDYISTISSAPPLWSSTRTTACEVCERDWIPLTYHHLIPKAVHAKVLKRGWHEEWQLNSVAWLCRACHTFVHRMAGNEELAREWWTVERLRERDDVQRWAAWVGRVRWKAQ
ncbi:MAG: hypothetical protein M1827_000188 [Pycnora praestabilis]|nr:MAG: hypothetical protein M1827_000188 [Pycnora praestabilis]